jgi:hypothetical protein
MLIFNWVNPSDITKFPLYLLASVLFFKFSIGRIMELWELWIWKGDDCGRWMVHVMKRNAETSIRTHNTKYQCVTAVCYDVPVWT